MGAYMATPSTEKCTDSGHTKFFTYGVCSMQGWRMQQEDAHNCIPEFDPSRAASLFAVYDGHGGPEVAEYCASHLPEFLRNLPAYAKADPVEALKKLFLDFDASLTTPEARSALRSLVKKSSAKDDLSDDSEEAAAASDTEDEEESDSEINALCAEAEQPLESVLERYGGEDALPSDVKELLERQKKAGECSQTRTRRERRSNTVSEAPADTERPSPKTDKAAGDEESKTERSTNETLEHKDDTQVADDDDDDDDSEDETVDLEDGQDGEDDDDDADSTSSDSSDDDDEDEDDAEHLEFDLPAVLKAQDENEPGVDSGTTACVALLLPMNGAVKLFVANAGDSRAVLCRGAAAIDLSVDHKPDDEDEKSRITAAGGTVTRDGRVNGGLNLSRAIGDHCYKQSANLPLSDQMITPCPDVSQYDLIPGSDDFIVIACDGVWNSMTSQEVVDFVYDRLHPRKSPTEDAVDPAVEAEQLIKICGELFDHCLAPNTEGDGTGCDNMTCIIVRFRDLTSWAKLSRPSTHAEARKRAAAANGESVPSPSENTAANGGTSSKRLKPDSPVANGELVVE